MAAKIRITDIGHVGEDTPGMLRIVAIDALRGEIEITIPVSEARWLAGSIEPLYKRWMRRFGW